MLTPAPGQPAAEDEEEDEEEERQPAAPLKRTVDEAEDKKEEEYDEEDGEEKATVGVMKALPEPEAGAPQAEPTGQRSGLPPAPSAMCPFCSTQTLLCGFRVSLHALCTGQGAQQQDCRQERLVLLLPRHTHL